ncbi:siderophore-interacting protein [Streptomyces sp. Pv4-95]|uniref:siderophore-interacting protein n=1 Tax=Streptomyces sp. Pv4-95 TaxID=3049543 RepID=UPI00389232E3
MKHGWEGVVLKLMRGKNFTLTVQAAEDLDDRYRRLSFNDGGMLGATGTHPTMWVRLWFDNAGTPHQRAYTLLDPNPSTGTFGMEFALHDGCASRWARAARPGDTIEATVQGTGFTVPDPLPSRLLVIGDPASLPAINSLLDSMPLTPATIWFETPHPSDEQLPLRSGTARHEVHHVPRRDNGALLIETVRSALPAHLDDGSYVWIACDTSTTRALTSFVRRQLGVPKERLHSMGYWRAT